ncbi:MAG: hypothetical protein ACT4PZ_07305 [Panacagrimonas sp.]
MAAGDLGKLVSSALFVGIAFAICTAIFPADLFYKNEFVQITGQEFPASGKYIFKEASYPDFHGDYMSCAVIEVSEDDFKRLRSEMRPAHSSFGIVESSCMSELIRRYGKDTILLESSISDPKGEYRYWGLVADRSVVIIHFYSW